MVLVDIRETLSVKAADIFRRRPSKDLKPSSLRAIVKGQPWIRSLGRDGVKLEQL
jgi:hypothetical protein